VTVADLVLLVADRSRPAEDAWRVEQAVPPTAAVLVVANKSDLPHAWSRPDAVNVSSMTRDGLEQLQREISFRLHLDEPHDRPARTNIRHIALADSARVALVRARDAASVEGGWMSEEFVLADLQEARSALEEVTGRRTSEDILAHIFERFCIGK